MYVKKSTKYVQLLNLETIISDSQVGLVASRTHKVQILNSTLLWD